MNKNLTEIKIETIIANHPEITVFGVNRMMNLLNLNGLENRRIIAKTLRYMRDKGIFTSERNGRHNIYHVINRIDCLGDAEKIIKNKLHSKGYSLYKIERCDHPGMKSTYFVEAKDTKGIVVTVGYLYGNTLDLSWQKLVNEVAEYISEV